MLKIQEFIKAHDNWRELLSTDPYNLKISEDDGFVLFKYNQIAKRGAHSDVPLFSFARHGAFTFASAQKQHKTRC